MLPKLKNLPYFWVKNIFVYDIIFASTILAAFRWIINLKGTVQLAFKIFKWDIDWENEFTTIFCQKMFRNLTKLPKTFLKKISSEMLGLWGFPVVFI